MPEERSARFIAVNIHCGYVKIPHSVNHAAAVAAARELGANLAYQVTSPQAGTFAVFWSMRPLDFGALQIALSFVPSDKACLN